MSNKIKMYITGAMNNVVLLFSTGGIIQNFFVGLGFSNKQIGTYSSVVSIMQMLVMVLSVFVSDRIRNVRMVSAVGAFAPVMLCAAMIPACFGKIQPVSTIFVIALVFCIIQNLISGFKGVIDYRLPYAVIDMGEYASLENVRAVISNAFSIGASALIAFLSVHFAYNNIMAVGFVISILFCAGICSLTLSLKVIKEPTVERKSFHFSVLTQREFVYFYGPNFLRGCAAGLMNVITLVCTKEISDDQTVISSLVTVIALAAIVGCTAYRLLDKKIKTSVIYLAGSLIMFLFLPLMILGNSVFVFSTVYFIVGMGYNVINVSGAVYPTEIIAYKDIGVYTSVRLIVYMLGQAVSSYLIGITLASVPTVLILLIAGVFQLISGLMLYCYKPKMKPVTAEE